MPRTAAKRIKPTAPDRDNPAWGDKEFAAAKPAADVLPSAVAKALGVRRRGPQATPTKEAVDASDGYVIGYEPDKTVKGSKVRALEVRVKRPGVRVLARRGYLAPPAPRDAAVTDASVSPVLAELLGGVVAEDALPMFVQVVPVSREGNLTRFGLWSPLALTGKWDALPSDVRP